MMHPFQINAGFYIGLSGIYNPVPDVSNIILEKSLGYVEIWCILKKELGYRSRRRLRHV